MPTWFFYAIIGPILWGIVNHADRYLLNRHYKGHGVGAVLIFSALFSVLLLFFILFGVQAPVLSVALSDRILLVFIGILGAVAFALYLNALDIEETSIVVPFLQMGPVFGYLFAFIFLGEILALKEILASIVILLGVGMLSFEVDLENKVTFKIKMILLAVGASLIFALQDTLFKSVAIEGTFWTAAFWEYVGLTLAGIIILAAVPRYRRQFLGIFKGRQYTLVGINFMSELLYLTGNLASNFAMLSAPVALVMVIGSYQPLFVLLTGILGTLLLPKLFNEKIRGRMLVQKIVSVLIIFLGSCWLYI